MDHTPIFFIVYCADNRVFKTTGISMDLWAQIPDQQIVILDVYEKEEYKPGVHYRQRYENEWYGLRENADGSFTFIGIDEFVDDRDGVEEAYPGFLFKQGKYVTDGFIEAIRDIASIGR